MYGFISMIVIPLALVFLNSLFHFLRLVNSYTQFLGGMAVFLGGILLVYSTRLFVIYGGGGSPLPFDPPKKLVTVGIYKYIRNPMFTASALIWLGEFFFFGSILLLPYALGWIVVNHLHLVTQDEKWLEKRFGKEYLGYRKHTPRYLPKILK